MYQSIEDLGELFNRQEQAQALIDEYETFMEEYRTKNANMEHPTVLVLMGLPGSYIVATENSYVGSLVKLAGGINVYQGETDEFLTANTEDMQKRDPDIIVRCAHALPDDVVKMFNEEFSSNDIWKHFRAVQEGKVYDLSYEHFGMSAKFNYPEALEELQPILYGD
jgi:iron complex transport system substrate-binding protein